MTLIQQLDVQDHVINTEREGGQQGSVDRMKIHHTMTSEREIYHASCLIDMLKKIYKAVPFIPKSDSISTAQHHHKAIRILSKSTRQQKLQSHIKLEDTQSII